MVKKERKQRVVGWKENVALPDLKIKKVISKIDTGANLCSIHAADIQIKKKNKKEIVHFKVMKRNNTVKKLLLNLPDIKEYEVLMGM